MENKDIDIKALMEFLKQAGREGENAEAWAHALIDLKESTDKIFDLYLPESKEAASSRRESNLIFWDIREELRHIEYHIQDVDGR